MPTYPQLEVNGVGMSHPAGLWALTPDQSFRSLPGRRASSVTVPGRGGVTVPRRTVRDSSTFSVSLWVMGVGQTAAQRSASLETTLGVLDHLFSGSGELFPVVYIRGPAQSDRLLAMCRRVASVDPSRIGSDAASVTFILEIPSGEWRTDPVIENPAVAGPGSYVYLNGLRGSVREVDDVQLLMRGTFGAIRFTNINTGQWVHVDRGAGPNEYMRLDLGQFRAVILGSPDFDTAGGIDITTSVTNGGPGANLTWLTLTPKYVASTNSTVVGVQVNGLNNLAVRSRGSF